MRAILSVVLLSLLAVPLGAKEKAVPTVRVKIWTAAETGFTTADGTARAEAVAQMRKWIEKRVHGCACLVTEDDPQVVIEVVTVQSVLSETQTMQRGLFGGLELVRPKEYAVTAQITVLPDRWTGTMRGQSPGGIWSAALGVLAQFDRWMKDNAGQFDAVN